MSLLMKKLQGLQPGTMIEVSIKNENTRYVGQVTENDFEESLEISGDFGELIISYNEISSFVVIKNEDYLARKVDKPSAEDQKPEPVVPERQIIIPGRIEGLSFYTDIDYPEMNDAQLDSYFRGKLSDEEKKLANNTYQSFKYRLRTRDISACENAIDKMLDDFYAADFEVSPNAYRFAIALQVRIGCELDHDTLESKELYDFMAIDYYKRKDYFRATVCSCLSILNEIDEPFRNIMLTILVKTSLEMKDYSGLSGVLFYMPKAVDLPDISELLSFIYSKNQRRYSPKLNINTIFSEIDDMTATRRVEPAVRKIYESFENDSFEKNTEISKKQQDNNTSAQLDAQNRSIVSAPKATPAEIKRGEIFYISWAEDRGKILSDETEYKFEYSDVSDAELLKKLKKITKRDLRAIDSVFSVQFMLQNGKVSQVKEIIIPKQKQQKADEDALTDSSLSKARELYAETDNSDRFEEMFPLLEKAFLEEKDPLIPFSEYVNCCITLANQKNDESFILKAYNRYLEYRELIDKTIGITCNVALMDLFIKMNKLDAAIAAADRILADSKIAIEARLNYIYARAKLLMKQAVSLEKDENSSQDDVNAAYEDAMSAFMDWEQRFYGTTSYRNDLNKKHMYYNTVLLNIANCRIKLGDIEQAEDVLKKILAFDSTNDTAKNMLMSLVNDNDDSDGETSSNQNTADDTLLTNTFDNYYDDETAEEQIQEEYKDPSGWGALGISEQDAIDDSMQMISSGNVAAAVAYLKAASMLNKNLVSTYTMVSYAVNHPLESFDYRLENISLQYDISCFASNPWAKYAYVAAVTRGLFYHSAENDYFVASASLDRDILDSIPALEKAITCIEEFRSTTGKGMDLYADYRYKSNESKLFALDKLSKDAKDIRDRYFGRLFHETADQKRFKITKAIVFENDGFINQLLDCVVGNDIEQFKNIQKQFSECFIRDGLTVSTDNIDNKKIEAFIDEAWEKAGKDKSIHIRVSSTLMGSLRNNIKIPVARIVELACSWLALNSELSSEYSETDLVLYRSNRNEFSEALSQAVDEINDLRSSLSDVHVQAGLVLLRNTVEELLDRVNGTWAEEKYRYFFADFLRTNNILLNDDFLPDLTFTFCDMPTFNVLSRIKAHVEDETANMVEYAKTIYSRDEDKHDFGTAEKIATYLNYLGSESEWSMPDNADTFNEQARKQIRERYDHFNDDIASARSRGQIEVSDNFLASIDVTAQSLFRYCLETKNYGFFFRFISLSLDIVHKNALEYGRILKTQLERLLNELELDADIYNKISTHIETQQYTVAEEMMYRLQKGDIFDGSDNFQNANEYLTQFWSEFDSIYSTIAKEQGTTMVKIISSHGAMKDRKGGEALVNNWPRGNTCSAEQIKMFLSLLGWSDFEVEKSNIGTGLASFTVKESVKIFSQREYAHPIAAFGTQTYPDGFHVVCLFGTTDSARLIDICKRLDSISGNKLLLVDFALPSGERRKLARLIKQIPLANTYMFVDRVSLVYLANHYVGGVGNANNRALFAISMPFTYYQPYTIGSSSTTAPELFSGRKDELLSVERPDGANLIYGGRQLGKTAILRKAVNETHDPENSRYAFVIDIKEKNCQGSALKVSHWLYTEGILSEDQKTDDWEILSGYIRQSIMEKSISYFLLMLDEADDFIYDCKKYDYAPFVALKEIQQSTNGRFKFVLAGVHNIVRFKKEVELGRNSVIAHLPWINVKPFDYETAKKLLSEPLSYLGFDFDDDEALFMQICAATNYYPGLLQMFCYKLIESLKTNYGGYNENETPGYKVTARHISKVLADKDFMAAIKEKFMITLTLGDDNYYNILALLLALLYDDNETAEGYDLNAIIDIADEYGVDSLKTLDRDHINASLEELCDLNILKKIGSRFAFRTRSFRDLLGTKAEIEDQLILLMDN